MLWIRTILALLCAASFSYAAFWPGGLAAGASARSVPSVAAETVVRAHPTRVWKAIQKYRTSEPARRKLLSYHNGKATIQEDFLTLPIIGSTSCTYAEHEHPYSRIDYELVTSDKLTAFDGCWTLTPVNGGRDTLVRLSCRLNTKMNAPLKKRLIGVAVKRDISRRFKFIKQYSQ